MERSKPGSRLPYASYRTPEKIDKLPTCCLWYKIQRPATRWLEATKGFAEAAQARAERWGGDVANFLADRVERESSVPAASTSFPSRCWTLGGQGLLRALPRSYPLSRAASALVRPITQSGRANTC